MQYCLQVLILRDVTHEDMTPFEISFNAEKAGVRSSATFEILAMADAVKRDS